MTALPADGRRSRLLQASLLAAAVLAGLWLTNCLSTSIYRVALADESIYLMNGLRFERARFEQYELFPLHSFWYAVLHLFIEDPLRIFKLGSVIQFALLVLLLSQVALRLSRLPLAAFAIGFALVATPQLGVAASPFAQRTALLVVLAGVWAATCFRDPLVRAVPMGLAFFVAAFARSELILAFYLLSVGLVLAVLLRARNAHGVRLLGAYAGLVLVLSLVMDFPILAGSERSFMAFGQHYAVQKEDQGVELDPWLQWREAMREDFGDAASLQGALRANPRAFAGHLAWSLRGLRGWVGQLHPLSLAVLLGSLLAAALVPWAWLRARRGRPPAGVPPPPEALSLALCLALGMLPIAISVLLIAPRNHYLQQLYVYLALVGALVLGQAPFDRLRAQRLVRNPVLALLLMGALAVALPKARSYEDRNVERALALRALVPRTGEPAPRMFTMFRRFHIYLREDAEEVHFTTWPAKHVPLEEFLEAERIDLVLLEGPRIALQFDEVREPLERFAADPGAFGFEELWSDDRMWTYRRKRP